ncbi:MAG: acyltransferase family protein [Galbitalea sp.]
MLGWKIRQWNLGERWLALRTAVVWRWRAAAIVLFVVLATATAVGISQWRHLLLRRFLLYDESYSSFGYDQWWAGAIRLAFLGIGMACCFAFLILMPRRHTWFSGLGTRTMYIYLLNSFILYPIRQSGWLVGTDPVVVLVAVVVLSIGLAALCGLPVVRRVFRPLVEPNLGWLFRRVDRSTEPAEARVDGSGSGSGSARLSEWHH